MSFKMIIREVGEGGAGGEARVKIHYRNIFYGMGGTVILQQPIVAAWREEFNQVPGMGKKIFLKHLILKKLDDYFTRTGRYIYPHVTRPLGSVEINTALIGGYWYQWTKGQETFPWEFPKADGNREVVCLEEWGVFIVCFEEAGINLSSDVSDPDNGLISQNIIHELYKPPLADLNFCWKRIDFGAGSMRIDFDKLLKFFELNTASLGEVLRPERLALIVLAAKYLSEKTPKEGSQELDQLIGDYRLSTLKQNSAKILLP